MKIPKGISNDEEQLQHYTKFKYDRIHHLYITAGEVELGVGDTQDNSEIFKLRNLVSVLKRRGL